MSRLPQIPDQQTAQFDDFKAYFEQLREAMNLHAFEALLDQELLIHGSFGHQLLFVDSNDPRPEERGIVTGCIAQRVNDQGEVENGYYAFYRNGTVEVRKDFCERTNFQFAPSWNDGIQLIIAELRILTERISTAAHESVQHLDALLSEDENSSRFTDSERPTAHEIPKSSSKPPQA